jgi:cell division protein CrgA
LRRVTGLFPDEEAAGTITRMPVSKSKRTRYTPPPKPKPKPSPKWVPILMLSLLGIGVIDLVLYYLTLLPGGSPLWGLISGFMLIAAGFFTGIFWR